MQELAGFFVGATGRRLDLLTLSYRGAVAGIESMYGEHGSRIFIGNFRSLKFYVEHGAQN